MKIRSDKLIWCTEIILHVYYIARFINIVGTRQFSSVLCCSPTKITYIADVAL